MVCMVGVVCRVGMVYTSDKLCWLGMVCMAGMVCDKLCWLGVVVQSWHGM